MKEVIRIGIVGGGPGGVSFLMQFIEEIKKNPLTSSVEVSVFEKTSDIGPGLPYVFNDKSYILNLPKNSMEPIFGNAGNFTKWLSKEFSSLDHAEFPPRYYFGRYLNYLANETQKQAESLGVAVKFKTNCEVKDLQPFKQGKFQLKLSDESAQVFDYIVLATGHMPSTAYYHLNGKTGYYHNPWDQNSYKNITTESNIGIIGTRLTAIDIAAKFHQLGHRGKLMMASRSGLLPTVLAKVIPPYPLRYLTLDTFTHLTKAGLIPLKLDDLEELFWKELSAAEGKPINSAVLTNPYKNMTSLQWMTKEISEAEAGPRPWQQVLFSLYPIVSEIWRMMAEPDQKRFLEDYYSLFMSYLAAFPLENAKLIQYLLQKEQLEVYEGLQTIQYANDQFIMQTANKEIMVAKLFNATGPGYNPAMVPLYHNMLEHGFAIAHPLGGLEIDYSTLQVLNEDVTKKQNIFVMGELTRGKCLATTDMTRVAFQANRIAYFVSQDIQQKSLALAKSDQEPSKDLSKTNFWKYSSSVQLQKSSFTELHLPTVSMTYVKGTKLHQNKLLFPKNSVEFSAMKPSFFGSLKSAVNRVNFVSRPTLPRLNSMPKFR